jgi:ABC-type multidrug transport system ATPase subunit
MPLVEARGLARDFGRRRAIDGVDLELEEGDLLTLLGPAQAGKTTLLRLLAAAIPPTEGELRIGRLDAAALPREVRRIAGFAPHGLALEPNLSAAEHLGVFGALHGLAGARLARRIRELLDRLELDRRTARRPSHALAPGLQRRVSIGAALVHAPRLVLLDEPTAGADPESRRVIVELILAQTTAAVVVATRRAPLADRLGGRIAIMGAGRILALGRRGELAAHLAHPGVLRLRTREELRAAAIESLLGDHGYALEPHVLEITTPDTDEAGRMLAAAADRLSAAGFHLIAAEVREPDLSSIVVQLTGRVLEPDGERAGADREREG